MLRARGRWGTDIDAIYARVTLEEQLAASARVGDASGTDFERIFDWVQPGR